jgi:tripartite-type tricarboxylate transporter receptor subunit TctC
MVSKVLFGGVAAALLAFLPAAAQTQSVADFYKGKNVDLMIGYSVGGGYDVYARMVARHMGKHIPGNPTIVPKNMEGAGSLRLVNWLYNVAPKDGSVFATIGRGTAFNPILGIPGAQFEGPKFTWIGSANDEVSICATWHTTGVDSFEELMTKEIAVGGTGASDDTVQFPKVLNAVLGTKLKIVSGYPGGNDAVLAMERGEVHGRCGWSWSSVMSTHKNWVDEKKINVLLQLALEKHPDLPNVPLVTDLAKTEEQKRILRLIFARQVMGRPFVAPPGIPQDRAEALRKAFMATMKDPEFLAEAEKAGLEITPVPGEKIQELVQEVYDTPPEIAKKAAAIVK